MTQLAQYSDAQLVVFVAGAVAAIRQSFPAIDGRKLVWLVAVVIAVAVCLLVALSSACTWQSALQGLLRALTVAMQAIAGVSIANYAVQKVSTQ